MNTTTSARARLTHDWQPLSEIKLHPHAGDWGFRDLRDEGIAEERIDPITRNGIPAGERIFYRLTPTR